MPTEQQKNQALLESELHWRNNVKNFPYKKRWDNKNNWFGVNCFGLTCPLCRLKTRLKIDSCGFCPLDDFDGAGCCIEWEDTSRKLTPFKDDIKAIHQRIVNECKKRNLTLLERGK